MRRNRLGLFVVAGLLVALALAFFVSPEASSSPDGLEKVAIDEGFAGEAADHGMADSPLADYGVEGVDDERFSVGLAGVMGVAITLVVAGGLFLGLRVLRRSSPQRGGAGGVGAAAGPGASGAGPGEAGP